MLYHLECELSLKSSNNGLQTCDHKLSAWSRGRQMRCQNNKGLISPQQPWWCSFISTVKEFIESDNLIKVQTTKPTRGVLCLNANLSTRSIFVEKIGMVISPVLPGCSTFCWLQFRFLIYSLWSTVCYLLFQFCFVLIQNITIVQEKFVDCGKKTGLKNVCC